MADTVKYLLDESRIPKVWYNIAADLPSPPPPPLHPGTKQPIGPDDLAPLFPMALIVQEVSTEREIEIPEPVRDVYRQWRPSPLFRARRLEAALKTPAKIYYKYEGVSPAGSHKPNTAVPQAFYNKEAGVTKIATETGAGQWGSSLAFAGALFGIDIQVFMVRVSYDQKPYRRALMETYGARCIPSPSGETNTGRAILAQKPDHMGSLGIAISEAVEVAATHDDTKYALGSVLNHVLLHQTVVGQEAMAQMEMAGDYPDVIVGCTGGGSNFAGIVFPFLGAQLRGGRESADRRDRAGGLPEPDPRQVRLRLRRHRPPDAAGQDAHARLDLHPARLPRRRPPLSRHGADGQPHQGARPDRGEGLPAVEGLRGRRPVRARRGHPAGAGGQPRRQGRDRRGDPLPRGRASRETILFNLCGHGHFDMQAYMDYFAGKLQDLDYDEADLAMALAGLPSEKAA